MEAPLRMHLSGNLNDEWILHKSGTASQGKQGRCKQGRAQSVGGTERRSAWPEARNERG